MANGIFLGGVAEGMKTAADQQLEQDKLAQLIDFQNKGLGLQQQGLDLRKQEMGQNMSLRTRALDLQAQGQKNAQAREILARADAQVGHTMDLVNETVQHLKAAGKDPDTIAQTVQPLVQSAKSLRAKAGGGDPASLDAQLSVMLAQPTPSDLAVGKANAGVSAAKSVSDATGVPIEDTLRGQGLVKGDSVTSEALLDPDTLKFMAQQYRAGDTSVLTNLGRGRQGAQNVVNLRREIASQNAAAGVTAEEQAFKNAEMSGVKSGQRTLGTKSANIELAANEFDQVVPVVVAASGAVDRTQYPSLNKVIQSWQEGTGDPNIVKFASGTNTLINLYARAISPTGSPTVSDKDHAREILNKAWSQGQFNAAVGMMKQEINAALNSPEKVREQMKSRFLNSRTTTPAPTEAPAPTASAPDPLGIR